MYRSIAAAMFLLLFAREPNEQQKVKPGDSSVAALLARSADPEPPPNDIPSKSDLPEDLPAFLSGGSTYNLAEGEFLLLLFDVPKALLVKSQATVIGADDSFFYCFDNRFEDEWAFSKDPKDHFACHTVWYRNRGDTEWRLRSSDVIMAGVLAQDLPKEEAPH